MEIEVGQVLALHCGELRRTLRLKLGGLWVRCIFESVLDEVGLAMVEKESPIESISVDGNNTLTVVSRLPMGSSCSRFNGYEINRRFLDRIEVTVTHMEVAEDNVPCTRDLPVVVTEIPLGEDFETGRTYTVFVNDESTTFTAR